jgi:hypothetical protein
VDRESEAVLSRPVLNTGAAGLRAATTALGASDF